MREKIDWFEMWAADKEAMINTMIRNMTADLDAGYNYFGECIKRQRREIEEYRDQFEREMDAFKEMDEKKVQRWCYYDMRKRGVIE